jgi:hypothetical protein
MDVSVYKLYTIRVFFAYVNIVWYICFFSSCHCSDVLSLLVYWAWGGRHFILGEIISLGYTRYGISKKDCMLWIFICFAESFW